jgi:hypothetical protein
MVSRERRKRRKREDSTVGSIQPNEKGDREKNERHKTHFIGVNFNLIVFKSLVFSIAC